MRLAQGISMEKHRAGSKVEGELAAPISAFAETIAPRGARVLAEVSEKAGEGISLRATRIELKSGKSYDIASDEPVLRVEKVPAESLVGFRLRTPVQVTVE